MNKLVVFTICIFFGSLTLMAQKPQEILGIAKESKPKSFYQEQAKLWKQETISNPKNAFAWFQLYKAERAFNQLEFPKKWLHDKAEIFEKLKPIIESAKKHVPESFEYHVLKAYKNGFNKSIELLEEAYAIDPDRHETYESLLIHYALHFQLEKAGEISRKILERNFYSNANLKWNLNGLLATKKNGVFISNGDMDIMPKWVLQYGLGIRTDVQTVSKWMMVNNLDYRKQVLKNIRIADMNKTISDFKTPSDYVDGTVVHIIKNCNRNVSMPVGTAVSFFKKFELTDDMYLVGTAFEYSKDGIDNQSILRKNFEEVYQLDYLINNFQTHIEDEVVQKHMNVTYIPGLIKIRDYYRSVKDEVRVSYYNTLISNIGDKSGRKDEILSWF